MVVRKAVISAAGKGTRQYPATNSVQKELFPLVDRDGITKPTIQIIAEEALHAGVEEIAIIVQPSCVDSFKRHFTGLDRDEQRLFQNKKWGLQQSQHLTDLEKKITYIQQKNQEGYGHAVYCAREWVGHEPFLLMLGDHLYLSGTTRCCAGQVIDGFQQFGQSIYAVQQTPAELLYLFGTCTGNKISADPPSYRLTKIVEKPDVAFATQYLQTTGVSPGFFLCFFGLQVLTPAIFDVLEENIRNNKRENGEIQLTTAQAELAGREGAIGIEVNGRRFDMGTPQGYVETQIALAFKDVNHHEMKRIFLNYLNED
jgi:UTP--glucose-1-phosphate uridylyltransferase